MCIVSLVLAGSECVMHIRCVIVWYDWLASMPLGEKIVRFQSLEDNNYVTTDNE